MTEPLKDLGAVEDLNGHQDYAFFTGQVGSTSMNPSSITNDQKLGYKGLLVGHGVQSIALTGQQVLNSRQK